MRFLPLFVLMACGGDSSADATDPTDTEDTEDTGVDGTTTDTDDDTTDTDTDPDGIEEIDCSSASTTVNIITPDDLNGMMANKDFLLVNVHIPYEGEIPGTDVHVRYTATDDLVEEVGALGTKVVVYCKTGPMSATAAADLKDRGYCNVYDMPAGMNGWERAGYTLAP